VSNIQVSGIPLKSLQTVYNNCLECIFLKRVKKKKNVFTCKKICDNDQISSSIVRLMVMQVLALTTVKAKRNDTRGLPSPLNAVNLTDRFSRQYKLLIFCLITFCSNARSNGRRTIKRKRLFPSTRSIYVTAPIGATKAQILRVLKLRSSH
jgi:hypothetical protein